MRFSLKDVRTDLRSCDRTYGPLWRGGRMALSLDVRPLAHTYCQSVTGKPYFHQPSHSSYFFVIELCLVKIELMICLFSVFEVIEPYGNYMKKLYGPNEYKLTWMLVVTFPALHIYFIYIKHAYFATLMKYILELLRTLFCEIVCQLIR